MKRQKWQLKKIGLIHSSGRRFRVQPWGTLRRSRNPFLFRRWNSLVRVSLQRMLRPSSRNVWLSLEKRRNANMIFSWYSFLVTVLYVLIYLDWIINEFRRCAHQIHFTIQVDQSSPGGYATILHQNVSSAWSTFYKIHHVPPWPENICSSKTIHMFKVKPV